MCSEVVALMSRGILLITLVLAGSSCHLIFPFQSGTRDSGADSDAPSLTRGEAGQLDRSVAGDLRVDGPALEGGSFPEGGVIPDRGIAPDARDVFDSGIVQDEGITPDQEVALDVGDVPCGAREDWVCDQVQTYSCRLRCTEDPTYAIYCSGSAVSTCHCYEGSVPHDCPSGYSGQTCSPCWAAFEDGCCPP
jgi:hypothetical protein